MNTNTVVSSVKTKSLHVLSHLMLTWIQKGKESSHNEGDLSSIPGLGKSSGEGHGNPVLYSCLENPMDREAGWATVYRVTKSQTQLKWHSTEGYLPTYLPHIFFIHSSLDIYLFPYLGDWLLWIMLQWTWKYRYLFERVISFLWMDTQKRDCWIVW